MRTLSRRHFLSLAAALPVLCGSSRRLSSSDDAFLEDLSSRAFLFFWEQSDPQTGLVLDRVRTNGSHISGRSLEVASTALTGLCSHRDVHRFREAMDGSQPASGVDPKPRSATLPMSRIMFAAGITIS